MRSLLLILVCGGGLFAQEMSFTVALANRLSTEANRKGDSVTARVLQPVQFEGDTVEGHVTESKSGNKLHGQAVLNFNFESLVHGGKSIPISCSIASIENSKGQVNVDEEGRVIRKSSNVGKAVGGAGLGGLIGGFAGGGKGAAIGAAAGGAASIVLIEVAAEGPRVDFAPGARFGLFVKSRGGPELSSLAPNRTVTANAAPAPVSSAPAAAPAQATAPAAANSGGQPNLVAAKIDFIPGEKTIFFDDFSDMGSDEPPPHWRLRGDAVELRKGGNIRELTATGNTNLLSPKLDLPKNFTLEAELDNASSYWMFGKGEDVCGGGSFRAHLRPDPAGDKNHVEVTVDGPHGGLGHPIVPANTSEPVQFALWVQDGRVRAYIDGTRAMDVNQVELPPLDHLCLHLWTSKNAKPIGVRSVRIAESAPDFSTVISSTGKYVSHGIHFDTDSDRLKPESAAVLKAVANGLDKNPNLKLEIDGYTDSTGDAAHNTDLSKRRAEAVKTVLISQYGVDAARLTSSGFGAEKPMASNDTPDGRAQNRRVEFVKQ
jgi:OmpA-OmpF porin, OOP family